MYTLARHQNRVWIKRPSDNNLHAIHYPTIAAAATARHKIEQGLAQFQPIAVTVTEQRNIARQQ